MSFLVTFLATVALTMVLIPPTILLARRFGLVDDPKAHRHPAIIHKRTVPRAGGLAMFLAFAIMVLVVLPIGKQLIGIILGGGLLVLVGLVDDKYDLKNSWKLASQILAAIVVVGFGVGIAFITNPLYLFGSSSAGIAQVVRLDTLRIVFNFLGQHSILVWADLFALFWIVWVINMLNFSSGVDGQMPGVALITLFVLFAASLRFSGGDPSQLVVSKLALVGAGVTLGFLLFNFYPAKIFPGDSGSYFLGFLIAVVAILSGAKVGTAILVMAVPLIDGVYTILRRILAGRSPFLGDRTHLHHRLMELGWGQRRIALFYWLLCAILGAAALSLQAAGKLFAGMVVAIIILGGLLWLDMSLPKRAQE